MTRTGRRAAPSIARFLGACLVAALMLGCSAAAPSATPSPAANSSPGPRPTTRVMEPAGTPVPTTFLPLTTPVPTPDPGPAEADFTIEGDKDVAGPVTILSIRCAEPSLDNTIIDVRAKTKAGRALRIVMMRTSNVVALYAEYGRLEVTVSAGSGASYVSRTFVGDEVYGFDAFTGGYADYDLIEKGGERPGNLGRIKSVEGEVDCNNQKPGSTTISLGGTPANNVQGVMRPVNVQCVENAQGRAVSIIGLAQGDKPYLVVMRLAADGFTVSVSPRTGAGLVYTFAGTGAVTLNATGASVSGDAPLSGEPTPGAHVLHIVGDATCGLPFGTP